MDLIKFDATNALSAGGRNSSPSPTITIKNGTFRFNGAAVKMMKLKITDTIALYQSPKDKMCWYVGKDKVGFSLREMKSDFVFSSAIAADAIRKCSDLDKSVRLKFSVSEESDVPGTHALVGGQIFKPKSK